MATVVDFKGIEIALPSFSGLCKCSKCGYDMAMKQSGAVPTKTLSVKDGFTYYSNTYCDKCKYSKILGKEARDAFLERKKQNESSGS